MWLEENTGERIYAERTKEALATKPAVICVACPYCMTMFEDGLKDEKASDQVVVKDIAEIVAEALVSDGMVCDSLFLKKKQKLLRLLLFCFHI